MRWTTIGLVSLLVGFIAWMSGPLFDLKPFPPPDGTPMYNPVWYDLMIFAIYAPFLITVLGATLAVFRALWLSTRRAELASLIALGRTRRALVGDHVRAGMLDGAIASTGVLVAGVARQVATGVSGVEFVPFTATTYAASDTSEASGSLVPPMYASTVGLQDGPELLNTHQSGWSAPLPQGLVDDLRADPALIVIQAGVLITDEDPERRPRRATQRVAPRHVPGSGPGRA